MILLFVGPSGSGKDTQADILRDNNGFVVISTGQLLRDEMASGTKLGEEIRKTYEKGIWTPDEIVYKLVAEFIQSNPAENFILTGAIRRATQIELLDEVLQKINDPIDLVLNFELDEDTAIERLGKRVIDPSTGAIYHTELNPAPEGIETVRRSDDTPEAIRSRLSEYNKYNEEIVEQYEVRGILKHIDASGTVESIHKTILKHIDIFTDK